MRCPCASGLVLAAGACHAAASGLVLLLLLRCSAALVLPARCMLLCGLLLLLLGLHVQVLWLLGGCTAAGVAAGGGSR